MPEDTEQALSAVVGGLLGALAEARRLANVETLALAKQYRIEGELEGFDIPSFAIGDVSFDIKFAIHKASAADVHVLLSRSALESIPEGQISTMRIGIRPADMNPAGLRDANTE